MHKIVLIDDDINIITSLEMVLRSAGFSTNSYTDGLVAIEKIKQNQPDIIILDIKMPRIDGLEVCNRIRKFSDIPIIFLTSKDSEIDELIGLRLGADDYIRKPFSHNLLIERIKSILRRFHKESVSIKSKDVVNLSHLTMNNETMLCSWKEDNIDLTATEFLILKFLISRPGVIRSRDDLINEAFRESLKKEDRVIDSHIKRIRKKFLSVDRNFDMIKTIYGIGYKIQ
ncbi:MAG: response regulator transcription factor [Hyphomicrobiales bacterium]|nr:response regulator transcription factor [Hyphomicrobiales bacterium]|tara:strand:+ start:516 stop:1199 length:684 start_codon:yes stop_codon:yes gene_type:complete